MAFKFINKLTGNQDEGEEYETLDDNENSGGIVKKDNTMILLEPRAYSESQQIADHLKKKNTVVVNMKRVTPDQAKRIVDFLSGTVYALEGDLQKIGAGIFLCTPKNVDVEGAITDDDDKAKGKKTDDDYIEW
jgi:cell division inhibitor SepF